MNVKKIRIVNTQGNKLSGFFHEGQGEKLIIICNGYECTKETPFIQLLAEGLNTKGYDVVRFDFSGTGESEGSKKVFVRQQVDDLNAVVNFFTKYKYIILLGGSLGALSATIVSITNKHVNHLITVNGFFGKHTIGKEVRKAYVMYRLASFIQAEYKNDYAYMKQNLLPDKISIPTTVIYTKNDMVVSPKQSEWFYAQLQIKDKQLIPLCLGQHNLTGPGDIDKVVSSIHI
jgi:predicted alpha/beta-fold hydrolase